VLAQKILVFGGTSSLGDDTSPHQDSLHQPKGSLLNPSFKNDLWELDVGQLSYSFVATSPSLNTTTTTTTSTAAHRHHNHHHPIPEGAHVFIPLVVNESTLLAAASKSGSSGGNNPSISSSSSSSASSFSSSYASSSSSSSYNPPPISMGRAAEDLCIVDVDVQVTVSHPCTRQLELVLFGPGPRAHDEANHEPSSHAHSVSYCPFKDTRLWM
jgi:hypothetical protein